MLTPCPCTPLSKQCCQDQPRGHEPEGFLPRGLRWRPAFPGAAAAQEMTNPGSNAPFCASFKDLRLIALASCMASTAGSAQRRQLPLPA